MARVASVHPHYNLLGFSAALAPKFHPLQIVNAPNSFFGKRHMRIHDTLFRATLATSSSAHPHALAWEACHRVCLVNMRGRCSMARWLVISPGSRKRYTVDCLGRHRVPQEWRKKTQMLRVNEIV